MRSLTSLLGLALVGGALMVGATACEHMKSEHHAGNGKTEIKTVAMSPEQQIERGRYLVMNVMACGSCHAMTMPAGEPAPARVQRRNPNLGRLTAERAAGLTPILEQGQSPNGMPAFHLSHEDAVAAQAYFAKIGAANAAAPAAGAPAGGAQR